MKETRNLMLGAVVLAVTLLTWSFIATAQVIDPTIPATQPAATSIFAVLLTWLGANWQLVLVVYLVPCVLAGLRNRTPGTGVLGFIEAALQWVSVLTPKNSSGTFKLPLTTPKA